MKTYRMFIVLLVATWIVVAGCSSGSSAVSQGVSPGQSLQTQNKLESQTNLWGYYDIQVDPNTDTAEVVPDRNGMFTANVVNFLNAKPADLGVKVNGKTPGTGYVDVDLDISITHPFAGKPQFNGYDVRGVFIGDGSGSLRYQNPKLKHPVGGTDQIMMKDPTAGADVPGASPDGYTRWYNPTEFTGAGLFGYVPGHLASKSYTGSGTLNAYRYFADGLLADDVTLKFLRTTTENGVFSSGAKNTRRYYLRFPMPSPGLKFNYAIVADWKGTLPADHPANAPEAVVASINVTDDIFFNSPTDFGGNLILDVGVFDWNSQPVGGVMSAYTILLDSDVLNSVHTATTAEMTPTASATHYYTYHFSIPAETVTSLTGNGVWVIVEYPGSNYKNPAGVPNLAGDDPLAAFFHRPVPVHAGITTIEVSATSSFTFEPQEVGAAVGSTIRWTNTASFHHSVTSDPLNPVAGGPDSDTQYPLGMMSNDQYSWVVPNVPSGTVFYYHCKFHGTAGDGHHLGTAMVGSVTVL